MLTVDQGNSSLKVCRWRLDGTRPVPVDSWSGPSGDVAGLRSWLRRNHEPEAAHGSVAGEHETGALRELLASEDIRVHAAPDPGLEIRCRVPERVGADRLYAAAGARALLGRSALVVDVGTALTVDAVLVADTAVFLGGAIAPGPELLARALASGTARLPAVEPRPGARALGQETEEAIRAGITVGLRGAAHALVEGIAQESGLLDAPVVLTGGARAHLLVPRPFTERALEVVPELVHRGLLESLLRVRGVTPS